MALTDIDINTVTNVDKNGIFDKLMAAVNENINTQYEDNRLTGNEYATVYLGSMQAVLQQSMQFVLQEQLLEAQIAAANIDVESKQYELDNILPEQLLKIQEEVNSIYTDRLLKDKQAAKLGLDNVMKNSEAARSADPDFVYTPKYVTGI